MAINRAGAFTATTSALVVVGVLGFPGASLAGQAPSVTGTIDLMSSTAEKSSTSTGPKYSEDALFAATVSGKISPKGSVYATVICWQGSTVVFQQSGDPSSAFHLADQSGQNLEWNGAAASCTADLIYRPDFSKSSKQVLDSTAFDVAGA